MQNLLKKFHFWGYFFFLLFLKSTFGWAVPQENFLDQKLDHLNPKDEQTFKQRYYIDEENAKGSEPPVLLYICGESPCTARGVQGISFIAKEVGAVVVALEHRYYGKSMPFTDLTAENLKFLTVEQALDDLNSFEDYMKQNHSLTGKWISIGGSYAGSLSAYYHLKFPHQTVGALASSAPVQAKTSFIEYDRHVTENLSSGCLEAVRNEFQAAEAALKDPVAMERIKSHYKAQYIHDDLDFVFFLADTASAAIQYGMDEAYCTEMTTRPLFEGSAAFANLLFTRYNFDISEFGLEKSREVQVTENDFMRQWMFQSCSEMGYFQVAHPDRNLSMRSSLLNMKYFEDACLEMFNIDSTLAEDFNQRYFNPLLEYENLNIVFTNGAQDPWLNLSITDPTKVHSSGIETIVIPGAAHCDDLSSSADPAVQKAQSQTLEKFKLWLGQKEIPSLLAFE